MQELLDISVVICKVDNILVDFATIVKKKIEYNKVEIPR